MYNSTINWSIILAMHNFEYQLRDQSWCSFNSLHSRRMKWCYLEIRDSSFLLYRFNFKELIKWYHVFPELLILIQMIKKTSEFIESKFGWSV
jgi:hypothetical protein